MSVKRKVTVPLGSELTGQSMSVNRLAEETSPYLLQHADNPVASASLAMPTIRGRIGFAGTTVFV
jgi:hypothetical protein